MRLDINNIIRISKLVNMSDYNEYLSLCKTDDAIPEPILTFSQRVGVIMVSKFMYPDLDVVTAYQKLLSAPISDLTHVLQVPKHSRGVGDTVAKITHATGLDELAKLYTRVTGKDCGCRSRQEALNKLFPYGVEEEK